MRPFSKCKTPGCPACRVRTAHYRMTIWQSRKLLRRSVIPSLSKLLREAAARHSAEAAAAQRALEAEREQHELVADRLRQALEEKEQSLLEASMVLEDKRKVKEVRRFLTQKIGPFPAKLRHF